MLVDFFTPSAGSPVRTDDRFASKPAPSCLRALPDLDLLHRRYHTPLISCTHPVKLACCASGVGYGQHQKETEAAGPIDEPSARQPVFVYLTPPPCPETSPPSSLIHQHQLVFSNSLFRKEDFASPPHPFQHSHLPL